MAATNFNYGDELSSWLEDRPSEWAQVIALRIALRVLPRINTASNEWLARHALAPFRSAFVAWAANNFPAKELIDVGFDAGAVYEHNEIWETADAADAIFSGDAAVHAAAHSDCAIDAVKTAIDSAVSTFGDVDADVDALWNSINRDCDWLTSYPEGSDPTAFLAHHRLWRNPPPKMWPTDWQMLANRMRTIDPNFAVWIDWYERRIRGERAAFNIPGDKGRIEDKKILRRLAEATDEDFWGKGHEYVNATLKGWLDEARGRTAIVGLAHRTLDAKEALEQQASPQAKTVDGKLDAGPNSVFDKPQYGNHLADLPSELLAYTEVILKSLPSNCQPVVRNCFTGFRDEMLVRGNRPILNIVKAMAASLTAELYGEPDPSASPDDWQLKDPREWGAGMDSMFASFFKSYHDLIHHFPMDAEREEFIANTPIDEVAASGAALTQPVDAVAELIKNLGKQGFATENIVRIIEAHQLYNRDVSQLPAPDQPTDAITPKRRHVLGTAGFYLQTYSVIGSSASIYSLPAFQELLPKLKDAIDALLGFIA
jgi:hypothetical protein